MRIIVYIFCCLFSLNSFSQNKDSIAIVSQTEKYIKAFYQEKPEWLEEVLHPELVKRTIRKFPDAEYYIATSGQSEMIQLSKIFNQKGRYDKSSKVQIEVLDVFKEMASVKLIAEKWVDYIHFVNVDGMWQIINVIWLMI